LNEGIQGFDYGRKMMRNTLCHSSSMDGKRVKDSLKRSLTGTDDRGNIQLFHIGAGDLTKHLQRQMRKMAPGQVTVDIDSVLVLFTDLSLIND
jgi:hypothetical protein